MFTSWRISQRRPGVATKTSTPRARMRRCFWADIPPTIDATLTRGGPFDFIRVSGVCTFAFPLPFFLVSKVSESLASSCLTSQETSTTLRQELRCDDTCSASSRVGARMSARRGRLCFNSETDFDAAWLRIWCRIGSP